VYLDSIPKGTGQADSHTKQKAAMSSSSAPAAAPPATAAAPAAAANASAAAAEAKAAAAKAKAAAPAKREVHVVNTLVCPPEKHISVESGELKAALKARLDMGDRARFDEIGKLMEGESFFRFGFSALFFPRPPAQKCRQNQSHSLSNLFLCSPPPRTQPNPSSQKAPPTLPFSTPSAP